MISKIHLNNKKSLTLAIGSAVMFPLFGQQTATEQPNVVLIIADQFRSRAIGYWSEEPVITPSLDKMIADGVAFNQAISSYPVSSPARAMLMTGKYPLSNGVVENCNSLSAPYHVELKEDEVCWSDVLFRNGYSLGYIGKWHLDAPYAPYVSTSNNTPEIAWNEWCSPEKRHGFTYWEAYGTYDRHLNPMYWSTNDKRDNFHYVHKWGPEYEVDKAIEYVANKDQQRKKDQPFALVVSMNPPHTDYNEVPQKYKQLYKNINMDSLTRFPNIPKADTKMGKYYRQSIRNYYACITGVDEQVGRLIDYLKKSGNYDNTIIIFTSDHGDCHGIHEQMSKNNPYEESIKIPLIINWNKKLKHRIDNKTLISIGDLYPTILSMLGYKKQIPADVETIDFADSILKNKTSNKVEFQPYYFFPRADQKSKGKRGLRNSQYTFVLTKTLNGFTKELFDRESDPFELNNIAGKKPDLIKKFTKKLSLLLEKQNDSFMTE